MFTLYQQGVRDMLYPPFRNMQTYLCKHIPRTSLLKQTYPKAFSIYANIPQGFLYSCKHAPRPSFSFSSTGHIIPCISFSVYIDVLQNWERSIVYSQGKQRWHYCHGEKWKSWILFPINLIVYSGFYIHWHRLRVDRWHLRYFLLLLSWQTNRWDFSFRQWEIWLSYHFSAPLYIMMHGCQLHNGWGLKLPQWPACTRQTNRIRTKFNSKYDFIKAYKQNILTSGQIALAPKFFT